MRAAELPFVGRLEHAGGLLLPTVLAAWMAGCAVAPHPSVPAAPRPVLRTAHIDPGAWAHTRPDSARARLERAIDAAAVQAQVVLFTIQAYSGNGDLDPLAYATAGTHARGRSLHAAIRLVARSEEPPTHAVVRLTEMVRHLAAGYDIDGLHLAHVDSSLAAVGVAEDVVAEALLVKPYLVLSAMDRRLDDTIGLHHVADLQLDAGVLALRRGSAHRVVSLGLGPVLGPAAGGLVVVDSIGERRPDAEGRVRLLLRDLPDTLRLDVDGTPVVLETRFWKPPYRFVVHADGTVARAAPWVELRAAPSDTAARDTFEFLARTSSEARGVIAGVDAKVYRTGVFFDSVALAEGPNRVRVEAVWPGGPRVVYEREFVHRPAEPKTAFPLWIDEGSVEPDRDLQLLAGDVVRVSFRGSRGQRAVARLRPGRLEIPLARTDSDDASTYAGDLHVAQLEAGRTYRVEIVLTSTDEEHPGGRLRHEAESTIEVRPLHDFPLLVTTGAESLLSYSLGSVRLGGPYIAEYGEGVVLQASGRFGNRWRIRLSPTAVGYISERYVEELPAGSVRPRYYLRSVHASPTDSADADVLYIPRPEPVPYAVRSDPDGRRILITLYGVETSSTWLQHRAGLRYLDKVTWRQVDAETYELAVNLTTERIWGYDVRPEGGRLVVRLPHPPRLDEADDEQPLRGLRLAIEAGHGGSSTGAVGLSGLLERDVNLATARRLAEICRAAGADVYELRTDVDGVPYMARRDSVHAHRAHVFISIHANAAGRGFLRVDGASTYYHDPFWQPLAARIYDRLLELGLDEFGVVGSFNYRPTRMSQRPAVLVEQAFMTHAENEELLASEEGQQAIARQVYEGLLDWLAEMR